MDATRLDLQVSYRERASLGDTILAYICWYFENEKEDVKFERHFSYSMVQKSVIEQK